jgi:formamidopyrimidine-DNA glycosylase
MPELPDVTIYLEALGRHVTGHRIEAVRLPSIFVLRSFDPPLSALDGKQVTGVRRLGKRIVLEFEDELFAVFHLMIAGRLRWRPKTDGETKKVWPRITLAEFEFPTGTLFFTEAGKKKRASLHLVRGASGLDEHDRGGLDVYACSMEDFAAALHRENHTLKRSLTDPRLFSGIGNAYSDEILHAAQLSPLQVTKNLTDEHIARLHKATIEVLRAWTERLRAEVGDGFPEKVTAFREGMAVHGRHKEPCPTCGAPVQRIVYAENETNYCAKCQTEGRLLADRALSRLLKQDWPRTLEELEDGKA